VLENKEFADEDIVPNLDPPFPSTRGKHNYLEMEHILPSTVMSETGISSFHVMFLQIWHI